MIQTTERTTTQRGSAQIAELSSYSKQRQEAAERLAGSIHAALCLPKEAKISGYAWFDTYHAENGRRVRERLVRAVIQGPGLEEPFVLFVGVESEGTHDLARIPLEATAYLDMPIAEPVPLPLQTKQQDQAA